MILIRTFSKTWESLKTPEERSKKAKELLEARKKINTRKENLKTKYAEDLEKAGLGELKGKDGKRINTRGVDEKFKSDMADLKRYQESIQDTTKRKPSFKPKTTPKINPETLKKVGKGAGVVAGVVGAGLAGKAVYKKVKNKKRENEVRGRFNTK
ncbi:MAG: hypothetical protein J6I84_04635 [Bacilli bacterium]|nr:hypothetical protein [Bacilli bacterium]